MHDYVVRMKKKHLVDKTVRLAVNEKNQSKYWTQGARELLPRAGAGGW